MEADRHVLSNICSVKADTSRVRRDICVMLTKTGPMPSLMVPLANCFKCSLCGMLMATPFLGYVTALASDVPDAVASVSLDSCSGMSEEV